MALLISVSEFWEDEKVWCQFVQAELPDIDVRVYPDDGDVNEIKYAVVWKHPHGILKKYPFEGNSIFRRRSRSYSK